MKNIHEVICDSKDKFMKSYNFNHKYALESMIYILEGYLNYRDLRFQNEVMKQKFYNKLKELKQRSLNYDFKLFMDKNKGSINEMLIPYANNVGDYYNPYMYNEYINPNICIRIVSDFLYYVDIELYNLFCDLYKSGHILFKEGYAGGLEFSEKKKDSIYIMMGSLNCVSAMGTLVHEMGHAYKDYLQEDYHRYYNMEELLHCEIPSEVLELMFYNFLVNNNIYRQQAINSLNFYNKGMGRDARNLLSNEINQDYLKTLSYMIGKVIAKHYTGNVTCSYPNLIKYIYLHDTSKVLSDLQINNQSIVNGINKEFCLIR